MKLIRLESDNELTQSQFTNFLGVPLVLQKNASVALKTIVAQFEEPGISINSSNDTFSYKTDDNFTVHNIVLPHGYYDIDDLASVIQNSMNCVLDGRGFGEDTDNTDYGFMWKVEIAKTADGYQMSIAFDRKNNLTLDNTNMGLKNCIFDPASGFSKSINDVSFDIANAYLKAKPLLGNGGFCVSSLIRKLDPDQDEDISLSDWYITIEPNQALSGNQVMGDVFDRAYAVLGSFQGFYVYKKDGTIQNQFDYTPVNNDLVSIRNNNGVIQYLIRPDDSEDIIYDGDGLLNLNNFGTTNLMVCIYIPTDDGKIAFNEVEITNNPFETSDLSGNYSKITINDMVIHRLKADGDPSPSDVSITFLPGIQRLLGFKNSTVSLSSVNGTFTATGYITTNIFDNDIVVEVNEMELENYDHTYKQRRNILTVLTSSDFKKSISGLGTELWELSFHEIFPVFMNINNKMGAVNFSSLTVRLTSQGVLLPLAGKMSCTLLFTDESDPLK